MGVGEMIGGGVRLVRTQPKAVAIWTLLYLAVMAAMMALISPMMGEMTAMQQQAIVADARPAGLPAGFGAAIGAILVLDLVILVLFVAIFAAMVRAVALGGSDRFAFLRIGMDEVRLVGLGILLWLIAVIATVVVVIAAVLLSALAMLAGGQVGAGVVLVLAYVASLVLLLWAEIRISLAGVFTVLRGRIILGEAWRATRGRFWTLFAVYLLLGLAFTAISLLFLAIGNPQVLSFYAAALSGEPPERLLVYQQQLVGNAFGPRAIVAGLFTALVSVPLFAVLTGAMTTAAIGDERLSPGDPSDLA